MRQFKYRQYFNTISIRGKHEALSDLIEKKQIEARECLNHKVNYRLLTNPYRRYRRGKNRCNRCGLYKLW